ncbi:MAG: hypothetical protein DI527_01235 [Chelatococcus sp.]|nr:MAG: hypothetical protein DI527_01235 [Chelatococcus sp.]
MGQVLQFPVPTRTPNPADRPELDLLSAVDFALRDLADIAMTATQAAVREQAQACIAMLTDAYCLELERA